MSLNLIATPLDSAVLETQEQYKTYYTIVSHAFNELVDGLKRNHVCTIQELSFIDLYGDLLSYTIKALRLKYLYHDEEKMRIDLTDSGFPNYMELRYLVNDLALRHDHMGKLPKLDDIKQDMLDTLLKHKQPIPNRKLFQASSIVYYTTVDENKLFKKFVQGKIVSSDEPNAKYLVSWSFYDVSLNRPFLCFMHFNVVGKKAKIENEKKRIYEVLKNAADRNIELDSLAYALDKRLDNIHPKKIRKIDLGPLHNVFAKDENIITHTILQSIIDKRIDLKSYAISLGVEEIKSSGNITEGKFFNKQEMQLWESVRKEKYVFASHRLIQLMYDKIPEAVNGLTHAPFEINEIEK